MENVVQQLWLAVGLVAAFIVAAVYWRRQHALASAVRATTAPGTIVYREAPTVRVNDSQRVDRARKLISVKTGESVDLLAPAVGMPPRFRITLKNIVAGSDVETAHVSIEFGGTQLSCGPLVEEIAFNEFALPRATRDEHRSCVFYYHERGDSLEFMRVKLRSIDADSRRAEIEVMQLQGYWPAFNAPATEQELMEEASFV